MQRIRVLLIAAACFWVADIHAVPQYPLEISADGRYLTDAAGEPVFFNADAPWNLVKQLSREDVELYFDDRQEKGFNALLMMLMVPDGYDGSDLNYYGEAPFDVPGDFSTPNEAYFSHVDWILDQADQRGITIFLTPAYLGYACGSEGWCQAMKQAGTGEMRDFGRWVGARYVDQPNIIWVNGGDADAGSHGAASVVDAVANGILDVDGTHLHTAHCKRFESGTDCYDRPWLDFNTSYGDCQTTASIVKNDYQETPTRPVVYIEGRYELESSWSEQCMRGQAYAALLGGAVGHFFGHRDIWPMIPGWRSALDSQGSEDMARFNELLHSRHWNEFAPDYSHQVLVNGYGSIGGSSYASAARSAPGNTVMIYTPTQRNLTVNMGAIAGSTAEAWWYDPSDGSAVLDGNYSTSGTRTFRPPSGGDWVLLIDNVDMDFANVWDEVTAVGTPRSGVQMAEPFPNPFNPRTSIAFTAPSGSPVRVEAFDTRGRRVEVLFDGVGTGASQSITWNAKGLSSGVYFVRMSSSNQLLTRKVALVE